MKYSKTTINLLDNTPNKPSQFRTINWVEINYESRGAYNNNSQIKLKNLMLKSKLFDYSYVYILVNEAVTITRRGADKAKRQAGERNKGVILHH